MGWYLGIGRVVAVLFCQRTEIAPVLCLAAIPFWPPALILMVMLKGEP